MKKTLIFAGLMVLTTTCGAYAFDNDSTVYDGFNAINYNSSYPYASKKIDASGNTEKIKVATTNYVTARVGETNTAVTTLSTSAGTDKNIVVGANNNGGLKADLVAMGGSTCATAGGTCNTEDVSVTDSKLNKATFPTGTTVSSCGGSSGGYNVSACGFIKNSSGKQWVRIIGGVASGS